MTQSWPPPSPPSVGCYRHPQRSAGVKCQRCGRPICPDCMIQASVGWHCPECTRVGARRSPTVRYRPGLSPGQLSLGSAPVTLALVAVNVVVFLVSRGGAPAVLEHWGLVPYQVAHSGRVWELFTSPFLHVSVIHIALNMLALIAVGMFVESALGPWRYLLVYLTAAVGGSVAYYLLAPQATPGVGASGAIFGLFGAYFVLARKHGLQASGIVIVIVINLVYGFAEPNIGWEAHVGGLVIGTLVAVAFTQAEHRPRATARTLEAVTCVAVAVVLFALMQLQPLGSAPHFLY